ncbi:MAG: hypothetical protein P8Y30_04135 [candidate division WOR-3 bacterium]
MTTASGIISENLQKVHERIRTAASACGRDALDKIEDHLKCAYLILDLAGISEEDITGAKKVLAEHSGKIPLTILCRNEYEEIRLRSKDIKIKPDEHMIQQINNIIGEWSIRFTI